MLSAVLKSKIALSVNIEIMRTFVFMRKYALTHKDLSVKLTELEKKYNKKFNAIYEAINFLLKKDQTLQEHNSRKKIGFKRKNESD